MALLNSIVLLLAFGCAVAIGVAAFGVRIAWEILKVLMVVCVAVFILALAGCGVPSCEDLGGELKYSHSIPVVHRVGGIPVTQWIPVYQCEMPPEEKEELGPVARCAHLYNVGKSREWQDCMGVGPKGAD